MNSPSKRTYRRMYYRLSRCFYFSSWSPTDRIPGRWPSGLRWRLEDGHRHSISMFFYARTRPHGAKAGRTVRHWVLSSESEHGCCICFGNYCFVGCLTRVRTDTSTCNSSTCSPVETRHPQVVAHPVVSTSECIFMIPYILTNSKLNSAHFYVSTSFVREAR